MKCVILGWVHCVAYSDAVDQVPRRRCHVAGGRLTLKPPLLYVRCTYVSTKPRRRPVKDARFEMRIDRKLKEDAEKAAAEDDRSLADLIAKLLRDYLKKQGRI